MQAQSVSYRRSLFPVAALVIMLVVGMVNGARSVQAAPSDLFFSEYIEGSSNNKALEIYNGTGAAVDLGASSYSVQMFFNGSATAGLTINLTGTVADGDVFVLAQSAANATILAQADQTNGSGWFNGDDAVVLRKGTTLIDSIGQAGFDPGTEWGTGLVSTADNTLRRKASVCQGQNNVADVFDPVVEWDGFATDTFDGLGAHVANCGGEGPPAVASSAPINGATNVALETDITVTFSEPVVVTDPWFTISCTASSAHTAVVSGGPESFTLNPDADFAFGESCTVTVTAANVADVDAEDPPDTMAADHAFTFATLPPPFGVCGDPATLIHDIQGSGAASPIVGASNVIIEGIVVGDYQDAGQFGGYHVQEQDADADVDLATSEAIFVFNASTPVNVGDLVRVRGTVSEFLSSGQTLTQINAVNSALVCSSGHSVTSTTVTLPVASLTDWEHYEGMLISIAQELTVTETFSLGRFGEVVLSIGGRQLTPTHVVEPGAPAIGLQDLNNRSRIVLDDANNQQNIDPTLYPEGGLSASNTLRIGDSTASLTGVLEQRFGIYRVQPVGAVAFTPSNVRPEQAPEVGGELRVAAMNVLNYFTTLDTNPGSNNGPNICGPTNSLECRGANTAEEFNRQRAKIISAILGLDADVVGLMEIENNPSASVQNLVDGLNDATAPGMYAFIDTGTLGTDAIKLALIYQTARATPVGTHAILNSSVDARFDDTRSRPAIAQTFDAAGGRFTVVVNHLKSKGSACAGDPDTGDGQGNCNITRTNAALALVDWINSDPTSSEDTDFLVIGDLNAYAKEDPIDVFVNAGYSDLVSQHNGADGYSYVFQGQTGYLDHALASPTLAAQVTGAAEWHINADEPVVLDYNTDFKSPNHVNTLYAPDQYRSSDHDPVLVGLNLTAFDFAGFFPSVSNPPAVNRATAGGSVSIRFSLAGDQGLSVLAAGHPRSTEVACGSDAPLNGGEATASSDGLQYDAAIDQYNYVWKTEKAWKGTCRQLVVVLSDGSVHRANFQFR